MGKLARLWRLSWGERALLAEAWTRILAIGLALRWRPFPRVVALVGGDGGGAQRHPAGGEVPFSAAEVERYGRWVDVAAGHHLLEARCLHRALALKWMLAARGIEADLRIGVRRESDELSAHAWLERDGLRLGSTGRTAAAFAPLAEPEGKAPPGRLVRRALH